MIHTEERRRKLAPARRFDRSYSKNCSNEVISPFELCEWESGKRAEVLQWYY
jgi:hypothetical protein